MILQAIIKASLDKAARLCDDVSEQHKSRANVYIGGGIEDAAYLEYAHKQDGAEECARDIRQLAENLPDTDVAPFDLSVEAFKALNSFFTFSDSATAWGRLTPEKQKEFSIQLGDVFCRFIANSEAIQTTLSERGWIIAPPGKTPMPTSLEQAQALNLIFESYIKANRPAPPPPEILDRVVGPVEPGLRYSDMADAAAGNGAALYKDTESYEYWAVLGTIQDPAIILANVRTGEHDVVVRDCPNAKRFVLAGRFDMTKLPKKPRL